MMFIPSDRDRLLLAFADAERHGIAAREAFAADERSGRQGMQERLRRATPNGLGAYVFWIWPDHDFFDADGQLIADLTLHTSGEETAGAVSTILAGQGFDVVRDQGADLVLDATRVPARAA